MTTPLRPRELPPFSLHPLLNPVFPVVASHLAKSATNQSNIDSNVPPAPGSPTATGAARFGALVSSFAAAAAAAGPTDPSGEGATSSKKPTTVRSVEAGGRHVWVGGSDGRIKLYEVDEEENELALTNKMTGPLSPGLGMTFKSPGSPPISPQTPGSPRKSKNTPTHLVGSRNHSSSRFAALREMDEVSVTSGKKSIDRIALLERLGKAVILSEGVLTVHSLPLLAPLNVHQFPAVRGVHSFSLDENELAGEGASDALHIVAIKKRAVHWLKITNDGISPVKDLPLRGAQVSVSVLRGSHLCIADLENYSIIDLRGAMATPLLPISQSPNPTPYEETSTKLSSATESKVVTPPIIGGLDPRQRPAVACVSTNEFLIASHTGSSTLGVFVTEGGEPCRGTLEWASNLRSLVVESPYVIALLYNNTLEVHSIYTQEIVQVIPLPFSSGSSLSLQPRSLIRSSSGLDLTTATGSDKLELVPVPLLPGKRMSEQPTSPRTPTRQTRATSSLSGRSKESSDQVTKGPPTHTILVGKNSLYALAPLTLTAQADALIDKGRIEEALTLADQIQATMTKSGLTSKESQSSRSEVSYVFVRVAFQYLHATKFVEAFDLFLRSQCDPRIVVRMFPDLQMPLLGHDEDFKVAKGIKAEVVQGQTIEEFILASLNRNYSPHIKPDVESALPTIELKNSLLETARDCLRTFLIKWRDARRSGTLPEIVGDSRKVDMVVDTTLARLFAEAGRSGDVIQLLQGPNDCVVQNIEQALMDAGLYETLASLFLQRGEVRRTLEVWTKIVDGIYEDESYTGGLQDIFDLIWRTKDKELVELYGLWLVKHDAKLGLKLFTDPKQTLTWDTKDLFKKMQVINSDAADTFLEGAVVQGRDGDRRLHADLIQRYIKRLGDSLQDAAVRHHLKEQEKDYANLEVDHQSRSLPSFFRFLYSRYDSNSTFTSFDRTRLKTILFLDSSTHYDFVAIKSELEAMEIKGQQGLTLERAVVYGKLHLDRQALSLLLNSLQDFSSAEVYCQQMGSVLLASEVQAAAEKLLLPLPRKPNKSATSGTKREAERLRRMKLLNTLVEMCLSAPALAAPAPATAMPGAAAKKSETSKYDISEADVEKKEEGVSRFHPTRQQVQIARILETQGMHVDTLEMFHLIPDSWPIALISPFLTRSLRRPHHAQEEASILKGLALTQNLAITERLGDLQMKLGGTLEDASGNNSDNLAGRRSDPVIKVIAKLKEDGMEESKRDVELDSR